jgi:hypothetical protein
MWLDEGGAETLTAGTKGGGTGAVVEVRGPPEFRPKARISATPSASVVSNGTATARSAFVESRRGTFVRTLSERVASSTGRSARLLVVAAKALPHCRQHLVRKVIKTP